MDIKEFRTVEKYLEDIKNPPDTKKWEKPKDSVKNSAFPTVMGAFLSPLKPYNLLVRDYLDKDGTFSLIIKFSDEDLMCFSDFIKIYLDTKDYIEQVTYMKVKNTGIITLTDPSEYSGFWMHFQ